jgi:hypothetical protein
MLPLAFETLKTERRDSPQCVLVRGLTDGMHSFLERLHQAGREPAVEVWLLIHLLQRPVRMAESHLLSPHR